MQAMVVERIVRTPEGSVQGESTPKGNAAEGRVMHAYDGGGPPGAPVLVWHHGSPQTGAPLVPVLQAAAERGIRVLSSARPSYGGSDPLPGRDVASAAADVARIADAFEVDRFAVMGASGGGPHALGCAALLPERVTAAVLLACPAPFTAADFDYFAGMAAPGGMRAASVGRAPRAAFALSDEFDPASFTAADYAALDGPWSSLGDDVGRSARWGDDGLIDDDVAFMHPWGFDVASVRVPVLVVQGGLDRVVPPSHGAWLAATIPTAQLWRRPDDGHISVLNACAAAMDWVLQR